ncbi:pseudaminic acid cytidylyltransferase [Parabacteroides distasonis]|jgi:pseudaminic acid cytidylyltransferase|uniref:pseudaminic acid cytidylyltransferase n=1 Tax=Parabacteroides distasonis TaxID=823 RepID=UPI001896CD10|nr:pseudaminic acid cytidylyltransferase [Parabacteroides distasonis]MDB8998154.1 pseudaminic acid cytidylyltransferase [Parabacteroides distasonis]MDB9072741.1 pseudaminic acid cytidylyltransferase [Parabacteroides distasonis]
MKNLCIIPARGGSKRIPRKNVKPFLGKPMLSYPIEVALETGLFDEVMVSTDDEEIAKIAKQYGAKVPFMRSAETASDFATLADVLREVLNNYQNDGIVFDNMCCILATSPMLRSEDISNGYKALLTTNFSSIIPVVLFSYPILRSYKMDDNYGISYNWPEYEKSRSQDLPPAYHDSGTFYWHKIDLWKVGQISRGGIVVSEETVQDIDTEQDWKMAEIKYKLLNNKL